MTQNDKTEALVLALAETVGLNIPDEARPGVVAFFRTAAAHAAVLDDVAFDDASLDLAPVFRLPGESGDDV